MLFKSVLSALALSGAVYAAPAAHLHHQHKRDVVHVTETVVITVGAGAAATVDAGAPSAVQTTVDSVTDGTATQYAYSLAQATGEASTTATGTAVAPFEAATIASSTESTAAATSTASSDSSSFSAGSKGITYSPYNADGTCKALSDVKTDLAKLANYEVIRLYGVDCSQVENVLQAKADGQKLFLGIYFVSELEAGIEQMANAIANYGSWDDVLTVSIGNELVNSGEATPAQIKEYVSTARTALTSKGYTGDVVSVDTHVAILNNPELCEYSDYIAFNAHAYWDGNTVSSDAGPWLLLQMQRVWSACGKHVMCVESGWPHEGSNNGVAVASSADQKAAISSIDGTCGNDVIVFTAFDDLWKNPGSLGVEQYWGIYN
ncbi:putative family 17 glucosidase [Martiniozyma asiatica (nom. inval.)]|nr:putative family 17 glucosidase [Martiniozyma asiatica]